MTVVAPSGGGSEHYSHSRITETSGGGGVVPIAAYPISTGGSSSSSFSRHSERVSQASPVITPIISYPSGGSSRYSSSHVSNGKSFSIQFEPTQFSIH